MRAFVGAVIANRYRLEQFLDEGAFGAVFRATHLAYGAPLREVAIKIAKRPMTESEAQRAFGEALLMAKVADTTADAALREHFVTVYDAGRCPDGGPLANHPFLVVELAPEGSLKSCLRSGPFPLTRAATYFDQILRAVALMHSEVAGDGRRRQPIAHRDLKPSNVLVVRSGQSPDLLKIADFGLAVEMDSLLGWVESGGDLAYLAPESFTLGVCSLQSDVYMLGLVFYEMLTGQNPFAEVGVHLRGADEEKRDELRRLHLAARQAEKFALLESHEEIRHCPQLGQVIRTALQLDPGARMYTNAGQMLAAWERARGGGQVTPTERPLQPWDLARRLIGEAEACFAVKDWERGDGLLREAMEINRDRSQVPDRMAVGRGYLLMVERLLKQGATVEAGRLANEGYHRRRCGSTCKAMERYYVALNPVLARGFQQEANQCIDRE